MLRIIAQPTCFRPHENDKLKQNFHLANEVLFFGCSIETTFEQRFCKSKIVFSKKYQTFSQNPWMEDTGQEAQLEVRAWRDPTLPVILYSIRFSISFRISYEDKWLIWDSSVPVQPQKWNFDETKGQNSRKVENQKNQKIIRTF